MCKQVVCLCANNILLKKNKWWTRIGLAGHSWPTTALNCLQINLPLLLDWKTPMLELSLICTSAKPQILHISYRTWFSQYLDEFPLEKFSTAQAGIQWICCSPCPISATLWSLLLFKTIVSPSGTQRLQSCESQNKRGRCEVRII